ncbi:dynamin family protein [Paenibacillus sp. GCM10023250]|uniref:dynamin family protein n=1 Tax=Paenibacillus sp. GCM10023250 TaxID=3252648 RepID=UPI00360D3624
MMHTKVKDEEFLQTITRIAGVLEQSSQFINNEQLFEFRNKVDNIKQNLATIKETERVLKIGIVGDVKAGKSSFLNALIFEGESVLPKAPTPMTAALTKIGHSETPYAKIVYYTDYDWQGIEKLSKEYDTLIQRKLGEELKSYIPTDISGYAYPPPTYESVEQMIMESIPVHIRACKELTRMVEQSNLDVYEWLGKTQEINGLASQKAFIQELNQYVGSNGTFTPIVKHTEIYLDNPLLKDIEVIDTPGLNDPILSRSRKTQDFLINCDVVFLLSYVGQFLGERDIQFLTKTLPGEGIRKAVLIGSKFDSGILDYKVRMAPFTEAFKKSRQTFNTQAVHNVEELTKSQNCPPVLRNLQESLPPTFISSLMYAAAKHIQDNVPLPEEEQNVITQMKKRFEGFLDTPEFLFQLSNIENTKNKIFNELKIQKEQTILERVSDLTSSQKSHILNMLDNIHIAILKSQEDLNHYDFEQLQQKLKALRSKLNSIRIEVKSIFEKSSIDAQRILKDLEVDIAKEIDNFLGVTVSTRTETRERTRSVGFLGLKKEHYTVTDTINSANVHEAISSLRKYTTRTKELVNREFRSLFNLNDVKKQLKDAVIGAFDLSDEKFNERDILVPMDIVLGRLSIPSLEINTHGYDEAILSKFSTGVIEGNAISELMYEQEKMLREISNDIVKRLQSLAEQINNSLVDQASVFVDNIEKQLTHNVELVQNLLKDKEKSIQKYELLVEQVQSFKMEIRHH